MATTYSEIFSLKDLTPADFFSLAVQTCQELQYTIVFVNHTGLIAQIKTGIFKWGEELRIHITEENADITSRSTGGEWHDWGKNKKMVKKFIETLNIQKAQTDTTELERIYTALSVHFVPPERDLLLQPIPSGMSMLKEFLTLFLPKKEFLVTPLFIHANIILYVLMLIAGVHWMEPSTEDLLHWGANFREVTVHDEWWRLLSCCFLHIGLVHLLMNMYALLYIGLLLEPILGPLRFFTAYILTGIVASASSLWWNELTVSAGASGAIFGMYGLFLALLTTKLIEKQARKTMLFSTLIFIGYNLTNGLKGNIDHAAHLGGLLSGLVVGYIFYYALREVENQRRAVATVGSVIVIIAGITFWLCTHLSGDLARYMSSMNRLQHLESEALMVYNVPENESERILQGLQNTGIPAWKQCIEIIDSSRHYKLPEGMKKRNELISVYCRLRLKAFELHAKLLEEKSNQYRQELDRCNHAITIKLKELEALK